MKVVRFLFLVALFFNVTNSQGIYNFKNNAQLIQRRNCTCDGFHFYTAASFCIPEVRNYTVINPVPGVSYKKCIASKNSLNIVALSSVSGIFIIKITYTDEQIVEHVLHFLSKSS